MNILLTTTIYPPDVGGPATYASEIKKRLEQRGHKLNVVTTSISAYEADNVYKLTKKTNIKIIGFFIHSLQIFWFLIKFSGKTDVIYTLDPKFLGFISILAGYIIRKPTILRFSGDRVWEIAFNKGITLKGPSHFFKNFNAGLYLKFLFYFQKIVLNMSDKIIVPSHDMKNLTVDYYKIKPSKITVIHNSIELNHSKTKSGEIFNSKKMKSYKTTVKTKLMKPAHKPKKSDVTVLYVSRLIKLHRVDMVIRVIGNISRNNPNIKLIIAGDGPEMDHLKDIAERLDIIHLITFLGNVNRNKLGEVYQSADILIHNRIYDVFPHVLIEANKYKIPIVTASEGGAREIVIDGKTGLIVKTGTMKELEKKINMLINNPSLREELAENAYEHLKNNFTWEINLPKLEDQLKNLI